MPLSYKTEDTIKNVIYDIVWTIKRLETLLTEPIKRKYIRQWERNEKFLCNCGFSQTLTLLRDDLYLFLNETFRKTLNIFNVAFRNNDIFFS